MFQGRKHPGFLKTFEKFFSFLFFLFLLFFFEKFDFQRMFSPLKHVGHFLLNFRRKDLLHPQKNNLRGVGVVKTLKNWGCDR